MCEKQRLYCLPVTQYIKILNLEIPVEVFVTKLQLHLNFIFYMRDTFFLSLENRGGGEGIFTVALGGNFSVSLPLVVFSVTPRW